MGGAVVVEFYSDGVDAGEDVVVGFVVPDVLFGGEAVEGGVEAEHDYFDYSALGGGEGYFGVVAADADVLDFAFLLELLDVVEVGAVEDLVPFFEVVDDVHHADFDVVGVEEL